MRILFVATVDIHIINHHLRIIHKLKELGHTVDLAANGDFKNDDISVKFNVPFSKSPTSSDNLKAMKMIGRIIREGNYDVISCHTPISSFLTRMAAKDFKGRMMYMAHGFHFFKGCPAANTLIYKNMERLAAHNTDTLITINREDYEAAQLFRYRKGGGPVLVPGVGIDLEQIEENRIERSEARNRMGVPQDGYVVVSVGELNVNKNHSFVMKALKDRFVSDPQLHYVICGVGPKKEEYEQFIRENHLEGRIHLMGYREDIRQLLFGADVYVSPSYREGLPVSVLEAMAAGIPVLASDVRGNRDLVVNGQDGFIYPTEDQEAFLNAYDRLRQDEILRAQISYHEYEDVRKYGIEEIDPQLLALYKAK